MPKKNKGKKLTKLKLVHADLCTRMPMELWNGNR